MFRSLRAAVGFLTRVPMGTVDGSSMGGAIAWFPFVGVLIGALAGGVYAGAFWLTSPLVAASLAISAEALTTGAFHHDGLADMADGFGGGWTVERRLEIMKDSRHGTYGVVSLILVLVIQVASLGSLTARQGFAALIAANCLGRIGAVAVMVFMRPARADGLGVEYREGLRVGVVALGGLAGLAIVVTIVGASTAVLVIAALVGALAVALLAHRKIGGMAGDVLGAVEQIAATCVLVAASALAQHDHLLLWWR